MCLTMATQFLDMNKMKFLLIRQNEAGVVNRWNTDMMETVMDGKAHLYYMYSVKYSQKISVGGTKMVSCDWSFGIMVINELVGNNGNQ